jgi:polysaccharide biosynthesis transport protein
MPTHSRQFADEPTAAEDSIPVRGPRGEWEDEEFGPAWYVIALQRWWVLIFVGALVGGSIAFWNASRRPLQYQGVTTLLVVPPSQPGGAQMNPATFQAIVQNLSLASQVIDELRLQDTLTPHRFLERALSVEEVRGTNIVRVKVTLPDPQLAADASRRMAQKAIVLAQEIAQLNGVSVQEQLKRYLTDAAERMQQAERELLEYKQRAQVDLIKGDTDAQLKARAELLPLVIELEGERARLTAAENEIKRQQPVLQTARTPAAEEALRQVQAEEVLRRVQPPPKPKSADDETDDQARDPSRGEIKAQQLDLTNPFINPVYQTLDFQIATSRTRIAALERERDEVMNVKKLGGNELAQLSELYRREIDQARLQASYDLSMKVHGDLALRYEQSRTQPVGNTSQLQVVDQALPPDDPVARKRLQNGVLGAGLGFIATALIALLWEGRRRQTPPPQSA